MTSAASRSRALGQQFAGATDDRGALLDRPVPQDLPSQEEVFAPDYAPDDMAEIAQKLRKEAGLF